MIDPVNSVEEMCFKAIKHSLEIAVVPIRKFLILFYIYLKLLFGKAPECKIFQMMITVIETKKEWRDLKYQKELLLLLDDKSEATRFRLLP